jgi:hypothetical protein
MLVIIRVKVWMTVSMPICMRVDMAVVVIDLNRTVLILFL